MYERERGTGGGGGGAEEQRISDQRDFKRRERRFWADLTLAKSRE